MEHSAINLSRTELLCVWEQHAWPENSYVWLGIHRRYSETGVSFHIPVFGVWWDSSPSGNCVDNHHIYVLHHLNTKQAYY